MTPLETLWRAAIGGLPTLSLAGAVKPDAGALAGGAEKPAPGPFQPQSDGSARMTRPAPRRQFDQVPAAQQAGILCNDPRFQRFAATRCGFPDTEFNAHAAAEYLRDCCRIDSRSRLNTDSAAMKRFQTLRTEFDAWTGRIAAQR